jgi:rubrerythrin
LKVISRRVVIMGETISNLVKAFIGESQARNRYTFYAKQAKKEGFEQISEIFTVTAEQEREHAKWLYRMIMDIKKKENLDMDAIEVEAGCPLALGDTKANLMAAIEGETYEHDTMYPEFAEVAEKEGYPEVAERLKAIAVAEKHHGDRYAKLLEQVEAGTVFKKDSEVTWVCRKCGYRHKGQKPEDECPSCGHETAYFHLVLHVKWILCMPKFFRGKKNDKEC